MKFIIYSLVFASVLFGASIKSNENFDKEMFDDGKKVFQNKCVSCHVQFIKVKTLMKNFTQMDNKLLKLIAPTGNEISYRLKLMLGDKSDVESQLFEDTEFIRDYLNNPDKEKTICMHTVIKHFDTMPSMKGRISDDEIDEVSHFLYFLEEND